MSGTNAAPYTTGSSLLVYLEVLQDARDGPETVAEDTIGAKCLRSRRRPLSAAPVGGGGSLGSTSPESHPSRYPVCFFYGVWRMQNRKSLSAKRARLSGPDLGLCNQHSPRVRRVQHDMAASAYPTPSIRKFLRQETRS
jgi:hypothetical protein